MHEEPNAIDSEPSLEGRLDNSRIDPLELVETDVYGRVKFFDNRKGFGFIIHSEGDVLVHFTSIVAKGYRTLSRDQRVVYDLYQKKQTDHGNGLYADNVRVD